jgi:hypothetical protein
MIAGIPTLASRPFFKPEKKRERRSEIATAREQAFWREAAREQAKRQMAQEAALRARLATITDEQANAAIAVLSREEYSKLQRLAPFELRKIGYFQPIEGSAAWGRACRMVIKNLLAREMPIGEVEEDYEAQRFEDYEEEF